MIPGFSHFHPVIKGAEFNTDQSLRFSLWRIWDDGLPLALFVGLNPSKADAETDDPTMRRVGRFARDLGFGGFYMVNVFPHISTDPKGIDPEVGLEENDMHIQRLSSRCGAVILCWGRSDLVRKSGRDELFVRQFPGALALGRNQDGSPKHPLYLRADSQLAPYLDS